MFLYNINIFFQKAEVKLKTWRKLGEVKDIFGFVCVIEVASDVQQGDWQNE